MDREIRALGDFETFLLKSGTIPENKNKFYLHWVRKFLKSVNYQSVPKKASCHTLCHSFVTHLLEAGHYIRTIQELLGYKHVNTTMIYTHMIRKKPSEIRSPLDG